MTALSSAHDVLLESAGTIDLGGLLTRLMSPFVDRNKPYDLRGSPVDLRRVQITPFCLVLHELATNSAKYGAIRQGSNIHVVWTVADGAVRLLWVKDTRSEPDQTKRQAGFGQTLFRRATRQLNGELAQSWRGSVLTVSFGFPLADE